jgi:mRNA degradation ribonuclease J1/J2
VSCVALAITTPLGVIIHTGDFKVDPTPTDNQLFDLHTLADYGKRGVLLLMSDSTNVDRPGYTESERAVVPRFEDLFVRSPRRLIISCFSSSIHRLQTILGSGRRAWSQGRVPGAQHAGGHRDRARHGTAGCSQRRATAAAGSDEHASE